MALYPKDPAATLDYTIDWISGYLADQTISESYWDITPREPSGVRVVSHIAGPTQTTVTLAEGRPGHVYRISNRVVLSDGRADERALTIRVEHR